MDKIYKFDFRNIVLDVRVIFLPKATVLEKIKANGVVLGLYSFDDEQEDNNIQDLIYSVLTDDEPTLDLVEDDDVTPLAIKKVKDCFTSFAINGAFWGDEKPFAEIGNKNGDLFLFSDDYNGYVDTKVINALEQIIGKPIPIYKPRKFKSEWLREFPREFKGEDIPEGQVIPIVAEIVNPLNIGQMPLDDVIRWTIDQINKLQSASDLEVWRFQMWESE